VAGSPPLPGVNFAACRVLIGSLMSVAESEAQGVAGSEMPLLVRLLEASSTPQSLEVRHPFPSRGECGLFRRNALSGMNFFGNNHVSS
jgi:hypothetical protein